MARQEIVIMTDDISGEDITGKPGAGAVEFSVDGKLYTIDLSAAHREEFKDALKPFTAAGRRLANAVVRRVPDAPRGPALVDRSQLQEQRRWWKDNYVAAGLPEPKDKGRLPERVVEAYREHDGRKVTRPVPQPFAA